MINKKKPACLEKSFHKCKKKSYKIIAATILVGTLGVSVFAAAVGLDEPLAGGSVMLEEYASNVASGSINKTPLNEMVTPDANADADNPDSQDEDKENEEPEHVKLNLNYSRLGIANKVDTYLNVRKKPSKKSKVVGKLTKNAGCHVYKIKDGWAKIVSGKVNGWVKTKYMVFDEKAEKLATKVGKNVAVINTEALIVRALPSTKAKIYTTVAIEEEFDMKKENVSKEFLQKVIKKNKISDKQVNKCGGLDTLYANLNDWVCIEVDDEYAFVAKEYITQQYTLKRAVKVSKVKASKKAGVSTKQAGIVEFAKKFLGNRYVWGGTSLTHGTDCSGFTQSLYRNYGYYIPRTAAAQAAALRKVSSSQVKPGDLFFYSNGYRVNHVAMYIGGGMVIHASNPRDGIKISNAYYRSPVKIGRVMNE